MIVDNALISRGGDSRLVVDPVSGVNRYGCRYEPEPHLLRVGSCTASTITNDGHEAALDLLRQLNDTPDADLSSFADDIADTLRARLLGQLLPGATTDVDVVLTPSGTDAEFLPVLIAAAAGGRVTNVVVAPSEVGSGTVRAASGRHFDALTPDGGSAEPGAEIVGMPEVELLTIPIRAPGGEILDPAQVDENVRAVVADATRRGHVVLLHVVAHSKTGVHAPSLRSLADLEEEFGDQLHVVIDAAQGRVSRRGLTDAVARGRMVITTGSKFYGGPPFAGALIIPERYRTLTREGLEAPTGLAAYLTPEQAPRQWQPWRRSLGGMPNVGLLLRWAAALAEIDAYYEVDARQRLEVLRSFEILAPELIEASAALELEISPTPVERNEAERLLESKHTVFSFSVIGRRGTRLGARALGEVRRAIRNSTGSTVFDGSSGSGRSMEIGQPVVIGAPDVAVLRVALGAPVLRKWALEGSREQIDRRIRADLRHTVDAIEHAVSAGLE